MIQRLTQREKILAAVVAACALAVGGFQFILAPLSSLSQRLSEDIAGAEARTIKGVRLMQQADRIRQEYEKLSALHQLKGTDEEMISALLSSVESHARTSGVTVTDMKPKPDQQGRIASDRHHYLIQMDVEAPMSSLFRFIQELENSPELFAILKLNISPKGKDTPVLRANLLLQRTVWI